jgi:hypothetical protein
MLSETRFFADITLKSIAAIVGLLLFAGLMSRVETPGTYPTIQGHASPTAVVLR